MGNGAMRTTISRLDRNQAATIAAAKVNAAIHLTGEWTNQRAVFSRKKSPLTFFSVLLDR